MSDVAQERAAAVEGVADGVAGGGGSEPGEREVLDVVGGEGGPIPGLAAPPHTPAPALELLMTKTYRSSSSARAPREYQELWLNCEGLRLRAWLAPTNGERPAVVVVHGLGDSLESYLEHARPFRERGHSVLLVDLRGHGGSEGSYTTLGGRERADVRAAMKELRRRGLAGHGIVLMGHRRPPVSESLPTASGSIRS